jgi:hypothetical protein
MARPPGTAPLTLHRGLDGQQAGRLAVGRVGRIMRHPRGQAAAFRHRPPRSEDIGAGSSGDQAGTAGHSSRTRVLCFTATVRGLSGQWRHAAGAARCGLCSAFVDANDAQAVVVSEVAEVPDVQSCHRQVADQAGCGDPASSAAGSSSAGSLCSDVMITTSSCRSPMTRVGSGFCLRGRAVPVQHEHRAQPITD